MSEPLDSLSSATAGPAPTGTTRPDWRRVAVLALTLAAAAVGGTAMNPAHPEPPGELSPGQKRQVDSLVTARLVPVSARLDSIATDTRIGRCVWRAQIEEKPLIGCQYLIEALRE